jgi:hypothetical protein
MTEAKQNPRGAPSAGDRRRVSAVIPTVGRESIEACLASLRAQSRQVDEIVVVQDEHRRGGAWARNEGIRRSHGDLIAFVDDDVVLPPDWIAGLTEAMDLHAAAGAGGGLRETDPFLEEIRQRRLRRAARMAEPATLRGNGGLVMYRREWLDACAQADGYVFNEGLRYAGEDWELVLRLRLRGAILVAAAAEARHLRRASPLRFLVHQFGRGRGIAALFNLQRAVAAFVDPQPSLIWKQQGKMKAADWLRAVWHKAVGPFDMRSFGSTGRFALFWLGEKAQGLGFSWEMLRRREWWSSGTSAAVLQVQKNRQAGLPSPEID